MKNYSVKRAHFENFKKQLSVGWEFQVFKQAYQTTKEGIGFAGQWPHFWLCGPFLDLAFSGEDLSLEKFMGYTLMVFLFVS